MPDPNQAAKKAAFLEHFAETGHARKATQLAGVGISAPWDWAKVDPEFAAKWQAINRVLEGNIIGTLYGRATDPEGGMASNIAAFGWGKRHFPREWVEKQQVEVELGENAATLLAMAIQAGLQAQVMGPATERLAAPDVDAIDGEIVPDPAASE